MKAKLFLSFVLLCGALTSSSQDVVINKIYNSGVTSPQGQDDVVELLVTKDFADIRNLVIKEFTGGTLTATSLADNGGKFRFKNIDFWRNLRIGTLIVLRYSPTSTAYVQDTDPIDKVLDLRLDNTTYFTNEGGEPFNVQNYDMVLLKNGNATGTDNAVYALAFGISQENATFASVAGPRGYTSKIAPTNGTLYPANQTGTLGDYEAEDDFLSTTTSPTTITWGTGTGANNIAFIGYLRSLGDYNYVHRDGTETIAGTKTFSGTVNLTSATLQNSPTSQQHVANKQYVDDAIKSGASMQLVKTPLANYPNEQIAVLKNPISYGEGNGYSAGSPQMQGAVQLVTPLEDYMFNIEGTIMRFGPGWQEDIKFHLNAYGWSGSTINYTANPIKAYWTKRLPDLQNIPVTIGNTLVNGVPKTTITLGDGNTVWGSYVTITIDQVYVTNRSVGASLGDKAAWQISKVSQVNSTENVSTTFVDTSVPSSLVNQAFDNQSIANSLAVPAGSFKVLNGVNIGGAPTSNYWNIMSMRHSNTVNDFRTEIAGAFFDPNDIKFRNTNNNVNQGWNTFFHSGNTDYIKSALGIPTSGSLATASDLTGKASLTNGNNFSGNQNITGDSFTLYGPNSTWGQHLRVGGNGWLDNQHASVTTTNGNLHLDSKGGSATYLNHYVSGNTYIGTGGGNVGIGTTSPTVKLDVAGNVKMNYALIGDTRGYDIGNAGTNDFIISETNVANRFTIKATTGNVGIGTTTPQEKLSVNGRIRAKEVKVEPSTNWPDYVFDDAYKPLTLAEIANFIKQHKHLPEVPSAKEVAENGLELGEMNKILLKKVEELTLHLIEKERQLKAIEERLAKLEKQ